MSNDEGMRVPDFKSDRRHFGRSEAQSRPQRTGQIRSGEDFHPVVMPSDNSAGSFDFAQDDRSSLLGLFDIHRPTATLKDGGAGSFVVRHF